MKTTWAIVAKADQAKIYALEHQPHKLVLTTQFEHLASRLKKNELLETEDGHHDSMGSPRGNASYHPKNGSCKEPITAANRQMILCCFP